MGTMFVVRLDFSWVGSLETSRSATYFAYLTYLPYCAYFAYWTYFTYFQEGDVFTCEPAPACHRCTASKSDLLSTALFPSKSTPLWKAAIIRAASGQDLVVRGVPSRDKVVQWEEDGSDTAPGPNSSHYESVRKSVGAHLLYNAFGSCPTSAFTRC